MILTAYLDESGTHRGSDWVIIAGFVSVASQWVEFSTQWQLALNDFGLPMFHMVEYAQRVKPYDTWTEPIRRERLSRLMNIIEKNVLASVGLSIPKKIFDRVVSKRAKQICGGAYGLAAVGTFLDLGELITSVGLDGRIAYVFESGSKGAGQVLRVFQYNMNEPVQREKTRVLSLRFEDKRDFLPLQASDILAYELYKESHRQRGFENPRYPLTILADIPRSWGRFDEVELRKWADILELRAKLEDTGRLPPL